MESTRALSRAEALFAKRQKQQAEGEVARADYLRKQKHELANLERLRDLRLERGHQASARTDCKERSPEHLKIFAMKTCAIWIAIAAILGSGTEASAQQDQPFCLQSNDGTLACHFETMAQCQDALKNGPVRTGTCLPNPKTKP
jgi:hypothetical protein